MVEPNQPSELAPIQSRGRHPSQDQAPADDAASLMHGGTSGPAGGGQLPDSPEDEPSATGQAEFEGAISSPATEGEFLISPEQAQAQAREAADRMRVYRGLSRELTENEWKGSGTRKLILEQLAQLANEVNELKRYRSQYYEKDKESAILRQKLRQSTAVEMLFDFCLAVGGVLVGLATFLFDKGQWILGLVILLTGVVLLVSPLLLKHYQKAD